jgi:hypothetical protein
MLNKNIHIKTGMLLVVKKTFWTTAAHKVDTFHVKYQIPKGTILEIRYPYEWHFRFGDNCWAQVPAETLVKCCEFFGVIHEDVRFNNNNSLPEIMEENLYYPASEYKLVRSESAK